MTLPVLLVHGSFHTGACWEALLPHLAERGLAARTVTLSGHRGNPKSSWLVSMATYGTDVIEAAEALGTPCLLLGHSMGGVVISEAAQRRPDLFARMIYLCAFVPKVGRSSSLLTLGPASRALWMGMRPSLFSGVLTIAPKSARHVFYNRCEPNAQDRAIGLLSPQPMRACTSSVRATATGLGSVPKHYIECLDDNALPLSSQRAMQAHMPFENVRSLDSDHSPFICKPAQLAELIEQIATV